VCMCAKFAGGGGKEGVTEPYTPFFFFWDLAPRICESCDVEQPFVMNTVPFDRVCSTGLRQI